LAEFVRGCPILYLALVDTYPLARIEVLLLLEMGLGCPFMFRPFDFTTGEMPLAPFNFG